MSHDVLLTPHDRENFINSVIVPAWYIYDQDLKGALEDTNTRAVDIDYRFSEIREASANWVAEIAYRLLGILLAKEMSNPVFYVAPEDAIDICLAEREGISIFEAREIKKEDKKLILRDKIKEKAKNIFEGDNPLISDWDIAEHTPRFNSRKLYGIKEIKEELFK